MKMALTEDHLSTQGAFLSDGEVPAPRTVVERPLLDDSPVAMNDHIVVENSKDTCHQSNGIIHEERHAPLDRSQYAIPMEPTLAFTPRKLRVITVGAGFSGLLMAHKFQHRFPDMDKIVDHTIFEKRGDLGGTWLVNKYPGVQCDVPSHIYVRTSNSCVSATRKKCWLKSLNHFTGFPVRPQSGLVALLLERCRDSRLHRQDGKEMES
jgi:hypothetical protein